MFKELKMLLDEFYDLEVKINKNQKSLDKLESEKQTLEKKLKGVTFHYNVVKANSNIMLQKKKEMENKINDMIKDINK